eukprot:TRINITY_DN84064_c0_g1_i1.p1 TRINITY_DN84064_c0_g1~~TRINITY_DN84064_c0_g1_i1.p1  ORF type:complete len:349 (+),score=78.48 TRINITY_DN84064_c0_g1_i1:117-1163(+)
MKTPHGAASKLRSFVICLALASFCGTNVAQARSLRALADRSSGSDERTAVDLKADTAALDDAQAARRRLLSQRATRIDQMERLDKFAVETLLRQETAVETLAVEQSSVEKEEARLEQTQERIKQKMDTISKLQQRGDGDDVNVEMAWSSDSIISAVIYLLTTLLFAAIYRSIKSDSPKLPHDEVHMEIFQYNLLDCHEISRDFPICCYACFCPSIRWADTVSNASIGLINYLPAVLLFAILSAASGLTLGVTGFILVGVGVYSRQKLRRAYGIEADTFGSIVRDIAAWLCCPCCAIAQEARQVELVEALPDLMGKVQQQQMRGPQDPLVPEERGPAEPLPSAPDLPPR